MKRLFSTLLFALLPLMLVAQSRYEETGWLPAKEDHLVYDFCGILTAEQVDSLEANLLQFNDSTSNQIVIMTVPAFGGRDISSFAFEVGEAWGIGQEEFSNGVIVVVKPKDATSGEVEIATGMGLEAVLPDVFCKDIIDNQMIPHFREDDYYGGIVAALAVIEPVCAGEYSYEEYKAAGNTSPWVPLGIMALTVGGIAGLARYARKHPEKFKSSGSDGWSGGTGGWFGGSSWPSGGSSWSGGSSSGGFGGFGGGHFGGGGASGKW